MFKNALRKTRFFFYKIIKMGYNKKKKQLSLILLFFIS
jgi:hypothetical protein